MARKVETLEGLLVHEMKDLYDAEKQLVRALPKMAKAASSPVLEELFKEHVEVTRNQVHRLEQAFEILGEKPKSRACAGMRGLVEEGQESMEGNLSADLMGPAIASAGQKIEQYEIAGYSSLIEMAHRLENGNIQVAKLLQENLEEEKQMAGRLAEVSGSLLDEAASAEAEEEVEEEE